MSRGRRHGTRPAGVAVVLLVALVDPPVQTAVYAALGARRRAQRTPRPVRSPSLVRTAPRRHEVCATFWRTLELGRARELSKRGLLARATAVELLASSRVRALHDEPTLLRRRGVQVHRLYRLLDAACETRDVRA